MSRSTGARVALRDYHPQQESMRDTILEGLRLEQKTLPAFYFYDERGSQLFDQITELPEYYLTRTEISITRRPCVTSATTKRTPSRAGLACALRPNRNGKSPLRTCPCAAIC